MNEINHEVDHVGMAMSTVDSHCHASEKWFEPIELLIFQMDRSGVDSAVLIQVSDEFDNSYQRECVRRYPKRFTSVICVDPRRREDACDQLALLAEDSAVGGLRLLAAARSPGSDPLAIWRCAEQLMLPVSVLGIREGSPAIPKASVMSEFTQLVGELPRLPIVLEHQGGSGRDTNEAAVQQRQQAFHLSRFPNVFMKVGGVGEIADRTRPLGAGGKYVEPIPPYHYSAYEAFGPERIMWGSDYPPVSFREGYLGALESCRDRFAHLDENDLRLIFGGTASRLFFARSESTS